MKKPVNSAAYSRCVIQHDWSKQYAQEQREWSRHPNDLAPRKHTEGELDAYVLGLEQGWSAAVANLAMHGLLDASRVSGLS